MEAKSAPTALPFAQAHLPVIDDDYLWVYEDPDLVPFLSGKSRRRPETPLTAFA